MTEATLLKFDILLNSNLCLFIHYRVFAIEGKVRWNSSIWLNSTLFINEISIEVEYSKDFLQILWLMSSHAEFPSFNINRDFTRKYSVFRSFKKDWMNWLVLNEPLKILIGKLSWKDIKIYDITFEITLPYFNRFPYEYVLW